MPRICHRANGGDKRERERERVQSRMASNAHALAAGKKKLEEFRQRKARLLGQKQHNDGANEAAQHLRRGAC